KILATFELQISSPPQLCTLHKCKSPSGMETAAPTSYSRKDGLPFISLPSSLSANLHHRAYRRVVRLNITSRPEGINRPFTGSHLDLLPVDSLLAACW